MCVAEIATITYRSGPEWDQRFGRQLRPLPSTTDPIAPRIDPTKPRTPALCPDFLIESYLDHQVSIARMRLFVSSADNLVWTGRAILLKVRRELIDLRLKSDGSFRPHRIRTSGARARSTCPSCTDPAPFTSRTKHVLDNAVIDQPLQIPPSPTESASTPLRFGSRGAPSGKYTCVSSWRAERYLVSGGTAARGSRCIANGR